MKNKQKILESFIVFIFLAISFYTREGIYIGIGVIVLIGIRMFFRKKERRNKANG